ncbi:U4/U6 small nuclear ribonucleoprotein Prp4 isoform X2 [Aricia agestis]|uniref:U4/U6 small nuclear ribonucleoprotein Prp4 isoform X1 n=1 Tax=Aricia agestis TaxID=91739 RepID=UPI001C2052EB|nr:U4/U6 small nuclear ribonucleoprotein Prp4 isoform X1 [Aricia agestis]XP_041968756.1 U4/U6 small nuclear ribonucleoprotein Prp4 isoform X2 [Aricia agestis]
MSDDEDIILAKKPKGLHYGSLEEQEKARLAAIAAAAKEGVEDSGGKDLGDIQISNEYMDLEDEMSKDKKALLEEFERRRKARQLNVSTDDDEVRRSLRQLGEPVCLFGEGPAERRVRLRDLLSYLGEDAIHKKLEEEEARIERDRGREGTWYHEGPPELREARLWIARYSLPRAKLRLAAAREELQLPGSVRAAAKQESQRKASAMSIYCSQIGDTRPISFCRFSSDSQMLITSSWSGLVKVWSVPECRALQTLKGHTCNVSAAVFHPKAEMPPHFREKLESDKEGEAAAMDTSEAPATVSMASCAYDGTVHLWSFASESPIASLEGHSPARVGRVEFHPSGRYVGSTVFDRSWRLWDVEARVELLHQEGHAEPVYSLAFQGDGSLAATGGMDAFGRVWDLRTGRCVMFLEGHLGPVLGVDWSPAGYQLATAASDNQTKIWDLRRRTAIYTIPSHTHLVSDVRYQRSHGHYLLTSSYDKTAKLWSNPAWHPLRTLSGHDNKVMSADISLDNKYIATCSHDRTFKLWAPDLA